MWRNERRRLDWEYDAVSMKASAAPRAPRSSKGLRVGPSLRQRFWAFAVLYQPVAKFGCSWGKAASYLWRKPRGFAIFGLSCDSSAGHTLRSWNKECPDSEGQERPNTSYHHGKPLACHEVVSSTSLFTDEATINICVPVYVKACFYFSQVNI